MSAWDTSHRFLYVVDLPIIKSINRSLTDDPYPIPILSLPYYHAQDSLPPTHDMMDVESGTDYSISKKLFTRSNIPACDLGVVFSSSASCKHPLRTSSPTRGHRAAVHPEVTLCDARVPDPSIGNVGHGCLRLLTTERTGQCTGISSHCCSTLPQLPIREFGGSSNS